MIQAQLLAEIKRLSDRSIFLDLVLAAMDDELDLPVENEDFRSRMRSHLTVWRASLKDIDEGKVDD